MNKKTYLIEILLENKDKIKKAKKYNEIEFEKFITSLTKAENERQRILEKIKDIGTIDIQELKKELGISEQNLKYNIKYLKELGLLEFIDEKSQFFQDIISKCDIKGLFPNVSIIEEDHLCCGCGLCVSICPVNAIQFSKDMLEIDDSVCIKCGLCFSCCPRTFFPSELKRTENNNQDIKILEELNYYRKIYTAQTKVEKLKEISQDGGIVTTLLITAFREKLIDSALTVGVADKPLKPLPLLVKNEDELLQTTGTKYSNCHLLEIIHDSRKFKNTAIVGTPCIMEAIQKISFYPFNKPYYENISFRIGLFCMESFDYNKILELTKKEFKKSPEDIKKMGINKGRIYVLDQNKNMFDLPLKIIKKYGRYGCFFCEDLTAEYTDISVGSIGSDDGWSTVIIRTKKGADLFKKALSLKLIEKKEIKEDSNSFHSISVIAKSKKKKYKKIQRIKMIEQDPRLRINNFNEVQEGLTREMAILESYRCLQCGRPLCVTGCPVNIDIPGFIQLIRNEHFQKSIDKIKVSNSLPAICGRVCPQEKQCEGKCILGKRFGPVAIGYLERFVADSERNSGNMHLPDRIIHNGKKVACIGCGPASLTVAGDLIKLGYEVTIYEALHKGGGVLSYGIPEFRLPKDIVDSEIDYLISQGVKIKYNMVIGKILTIDDLKEMGYNAIFIGIGAGLPRFLGIPGENLNGVISANEYLTRVNLMKAYSFPEYKTPVIKGRNVIVVGGGNVAMDSARTALRLGAETVTIVYRRAMEQLPARKEELHHAQEEGIIFNLLSNPKRFIGDNNGNIKEIEAIKMKLGALDKSGRARPIPIPNSEFRISTDLVIIGIGNNSNPLLTSTYPKLNLNKWGNIETDQNGKTNIDGIYAAGDIVTGAATVISAMGAGRKAAKAIHNWLKSS